jgi:hypothetical protein
MWQTITQAEIEEAKARLSRKKEAMLSRHAAEIKSLDAQWDDIESFERVVAAFFEEYMNPGRPTSDPEHARTASLSEQSPPSTQALQKAPGMTLQIRQDILPEFDLPPARRLIGSPSH